MSGVLNDERIGTARYSRERLAIFSERGAKLDFDVVGQIPIVTKYGETLFRTEDEFTQTTAGVIVRGDITDSLLTTTQIIRSPLGP